MSRKFLLCSFHIRSINLCRFIMSKPTWTSQEGSDTLKKVVSRRIPQWEDGLRDFQGEWTPLILDGQNLVAFTATGDGKSTLFILPILVHLELSTNPIIYPSFPIRAQAVVMVITPTKGLATSHVCSISLSQFTH